MFLTVIICFSLIMIIFHLPSLWFKFKLAVQMESSEVEQGLQTIDPHHVINQYNLSLSESFKESTWQLMVQWGVYFGFSWFVTWRLTLSDEDAEELMEVDKILGFSSLYKSLISSILSLTYAQYVLHSICYRYKTSGKQKILYFFSSLFNTLCNAFILINVQTAVTDFGNDILEENAFGFLHPGIIIGLSIMITPTLFTQMVLPTSNNRYNSSSYNCEEFYGGILKQCLVSSLCLGFTSFLNSYMYGWGPDEGLELPDIAFNVTGNVTGESLHSLAFVLSIFLNRC